MFFQGIYSFHLICKFYWHKVVHNISLFILLLSIGHAVSLMFQHGDFYLLSFLLGFLANALSLLFIWSKNQLLSLAS